MTPSAPDGQRAPLLSALCAAQRLDSTVRSRSALQRAGFEALNPPSPNKRSLNHVKRFKNPTCVGLRLAGFEASAIIEGRCPPIRPQCKWQAKSRECRRDARAPRSAHLRPRAALSATITPRCPTPFLPRKRLGSTMRRHGFVILAAVSTAGKRQAGRSGGTHPISLTPGESGSPPHVR